MKNPKQISTLLLLIFAGEVNFFLPFVVPRIFRPTVLSGLDINNTELGWAFSIYGVMAMLMYLGGGWIADRYPPKKLMALSLSGSAIGGFMMATLPDLYMINYIYGFWGITTIFLFWAPMLKMTREIGGSHFQGRSFGWLDGGRGLTAALLGTVVVGIMAIVSPEYSSDASNSTGLLSNIYTAVSALYLVCAAMLLKWIPNKNAAQENAVPKASKTQLLKLLRLPVVYQQMVIILCAYVGYKITDDFSLMAHEVYGMDEMDSAKIGTGALYVRPIAAIIIGYVADRIGVIKTIFYAFVVAVIFAFPLSFKAIMPGTIALYMANLFCLSLGIYSVRALYFAIMNEGHIPIELTGTAIGMASFIGYTPDIFMGPVMGYLLDQNPGVDGHNYVFRMLLVFSVVGAITAGLMYRRQIKRSS